MLTRRPSVFRQFTGSGLFALFAAFAAVVASGIDIPIQVNRADAEAAANAWLSRRVPAGARARRAAGLRRFVHDGATVAWAVDMEGGGTIVISASRQRAPVVAVSPSATLVPEPGSPLEALLLRDAALPSDSAQASAWAPLLSGVTPRAAPSSASIDDDSLIDDVCVYPLVGTKWGQEDVDVEFPVTSGEDEEEEGGDGETATITVSVPVYNALTPRQYPSGCVATALGQLMRTLRWPTSQIDAFSEDCSVDSEKLGTRVWSPRRFPADSELDSWSFDWDAMPEDPAVSLNAWTTASDMAKFAAATNQIGALMLACGVAVHMSWDADGSGSFVPLAASALVDRFGYASAKSFVADDESDSSGIPYDTLVRLVGSNLDYGLPVELGILDPVQKAGHAILCDGYGYVGGEDGEDRTLYFHLNMGWEGQSDVWYALPRITTGDCDFTVIDEIAYNVFAKSEGGRSADGDGIVSGRVLDENGSPVSDVVITASDADGKAVEGVSDTTDARGIFALRLPVPETSPVAGGSQDAASSESSGAAYVVHARYKLPDTATAETSLLASTSAVVDYKATDGDDYLQDPGTAGNVWNLVLVAPSDGSGTAGSIPAAVEIGDDSKEFAFDGDPSWFGVAAAAPLGNTAARSGAIGHDEATSMSLAFSNDAPVTLSFAWKSSSEAGADHARFFTNGVEAARISGDSPWKIVEVRFEASDGVNEVSWQYAKDESLVKLSDSAWVDKIKFSADSDGKSDFDLWMEGFRLSDADADDDGDGFTNLEEYIAGSDPTDPDSIPETVPDETRTEFQIWMVDTYALATDADYISKAGEDPDNDGMTNLQEFVAGTDPTDGDDRLSVVTFDKGDGTAEVSWAPSGKDGRVYSVQTNATLDADGWADAETDVASPWTDADASDAARFYRVKVEMPVPDVD